MAVLGPRQTSTSRMAMRTWSSLTLTWAIRITTNPSQPSRSLDTELLMRFALDEPSEAGVRG
jgi:hypothetical protein